MDEPSMISGAMKRMAYERKFSSSLYAFNGITKLLMLKYGAKNVRISEESVELGTQLQDSHLRPGTVCPI
ncbi:hypothetical protein F3Y22_tig00110374pilonHSYRG00088 [Hibiscus syriacus]|uniref:Uncharacterized protein n=1 Tax=Hibiscus syriacus TaxID=106335 RepID=A0A6A3AXY2_HIBSY|nr:hypothetical protein F3Y22_tig00110374pilonHSYRG00088 [Hibiscus syriacus]